MAGLAPFFRGWGVQARFSFDMRPIEALWLRDCIGCHYLHVGAGRMDNSAAPFSACAFVHSDDCACPLADTVAIGYVANFHRKWPSTVGKVIGKADPYNGPCWRIPLQKCLYPSRLAVIFPP